GVQRGDYLKEIDLKGAGDETKRFVLIENKPGEAVVDPLRLPDELRQWAEAHREASKTVKVVFVVQRKQLNANKEEWPIRTLLQELDSPEVTLRVQRGDKVAEEAFTLAADSAWPLEDRGLLFREDARVQKADNPLQAVGMGVQETWYTICDVYIQLRGFLTR